MSQDHSTEVQSIGTAVLLADGTIELTLRAEGPGGIVGDGFLVYPPTHPQYQDVRKHLGELTPGQSVPVPPWS